MIWLTWRQYRARFLIGLGGAGLLAAWLLRLGLTMRHTYAREVADCLVADGCDRATAATLFAGRYQSPVILCSLLLMAVPLLLGLFWGAPLVAQEREAGTHQLVWTQSVSRTGWLAVKLGVTLGLATALSGTLSLLLTWAASRYDEVTGERFGAVAFASRNLAPLGYTVFAVALGVLLGVVLRRVVPAMALTFALAAVVGVLLPTAIRPHLQTPLTLEEPFTAEFRSRGRGLALQRDEAAPVIVMGYSTPGALVLDDVAPLRTASGEELLSGDASHCVGLGRLDPTGADGPDSFEQCLIDMDLHVAVRYQPAERYWTFQWMETSLLVAAGLAMSLASWWLVGR